VQGEAFRRYATASVEPLATVGELAAAGIATPQQPAGAVNPASRAVLVELASPGAPSEFRVGLQNFYAITRYNRSAFYASAVHDLARAVKARLGK
jgi:membrane-bound lytic murein transglycosylase B